MFNEKLFLLFPQLGHVLQRLALGLRNHAPYKEGGNDTDDAVESVGEPVAEVVALCQVHVEHGHEGRRYDEVENPLEGNGNSHGSATDGVGENLGDEHPGNGTP